MRTAAVDGDGDGEAFGSFAVAAAAVVVSTMTDIGGCRRSRMIFRCFAHALYPFHARVHVHALFRVLEPSHARSSSMDIAADIVAASSFGRMTFDSAASVDYVHVTAGDSLAVEWEALQLSAA